MRRIASCSGVLLVLLSPAVLSQRPTDSATVQDSAVRVFFDCPGFMAQGCDFDFLRTEITWVNWVRDREAADVHALISTQQTGGGGTEYTLTLIGLRRFAGKTDTLRYYATGTNTADEARHGLAHILELGLATYAATTPLASRLSVTYESPIASGAAATHDPWNAWVYSLNGGASLFGQKSTHSAQLNVNLDASRITSRWKDDFGLYENYNQDVFELPTFDSLGNQNGTQTIRSISRAYGGNLLMVRSLGEHWSGGVQGSVNHATFSNVDISFSLGPALEYDLYPYSQSTRRELTVQYGISAQHSRYIDTTIFGKKHETLGRQTLSGAFSVTQPWGSASVSLTASQYLQDIHQNRLVLFGNLNLRLFKGLSLGLFGIAQRIHDQRALPEAGATPDEILLRRRELATSYSYSTFINLQYRFGSTLNNTVNPRFPNSGGGGFFISN